MTTHFIKASLKKHNSASGAFLRTCYFFTHGEKEHYNLAVKGRWHERIERIKDGDNVVISMPVYADTIPSGCMVFLDQYAEYAAKNNIHANFYVICNGGYITRKCGYLLFDVMRNYCQRNNQNWCGGVGIAGGTMIQITLLVYSYSIVLVAALLGLNAINLIQIDADWLIKSFLIASLFYIVVDITAIIELAMLGRRVGKQKTPNIRYCCINFPEILYSIMGNLSFIVTSAIFGGLFRDKFYRH